MSDANERALLFHDAYEKLRAEVATLRARVVEVEAERDVANAVAATAYGASLDWEQILQDDALWAAQDDIAKSRVACLEAEADAAALRAKIVALRVFTLHDPDDAYGVNSVDYVPRKDVLALLTGGAA
jgi:hypothetical protein